MGPIVFRLYYVPVTRNELDSGTSDMNPGQLVLFLCTRSPFFQVRRRKDNGRVWLLPSAMCTCPEICESGFPAGLSVKGYVLGREMWVLSINLSRVWCPVFVLRLKVLFIALSFRLDRCLIHKITVTLGFRNAEGLYDSSEGLETDCDSYFRQHWKSSHSSCCYIKLKL